MVDATIPNLLQIRKIPDYDNLRYAYDITLMAESEEELKSLLMKVKERSEKVGLRLNIQCQRIRKGLGFILLEVIRILYSSKHKLPSYCAWLVISSKMPLWFSQQLEDMGSACHSMRSSFLPSFCTFTAVVRLSKK